MVISVHRTRSRRMKFCVQRGLGALPSTSKAEGEITSGFFPLVLEVFNDYLNKDSVLEVVNTKRGYTVMIWDEKDEQWFGVEHCKAPELLRDALLDGYRDFLEQQLTHNRRSLTETEILDIQNRCEQLYDLCGE